MSWYLGLRKFIPIPKHVKFYKNRGIYLETRKLRHTTDISIENQIYLLYSKQRLVLYSSRILVLKWKLSKNTFFEWCISSFECTSDPIWKQKLFFRWDLKTSDHFFLLIFIFLGFIFWSVRPSDRSEGFRLKKYRS